MKYLPIFLLWIGVFTSSALGDEPEQLPAPKTKIVESLPSVLPPQVVEVPLGPLGPVLPGYYRPNMMARWNTVAPSWQQMRFRPAVAPGHPPFYLQNGKPYYYLPVRELDYLSNIVPQ